MQETPVFSDQCGRIARKFRISITDRCNFRCTYCMPVHPKWLGKTEILSFEEIVRVARIAVENGIKKIRLTGGEPLARRGLADLVRQLKAIPGLDAVHVTTNAYFLSEQAQALKEAGLDGFNISLDSLNPKCFLEIARFDGLNLSLKGIYAAMDAGFKEIKINTVVERGKNDDQIQDICHFGRKHGLPVRFIEFMPLDGEQKWERNQVCTEKEILQHARQIAPLVKIENTDLSSPARYWAFADGIGKIGVISPVTHSFCQFCDRIRMTADGRFRTCLMATGEEADFRELLRNGASDQEIASVLRDTLWKKTFKHSINSSEFIQPLRAMHAIGG